MNYEVFELLEVGSAGATILDKRTTNLDEWMEPFGVDAEALNE
jgi:hypothetical protein